MKITRSTDYLKFERGHPDGVGSQRLYLFPNGFGLVASFTIDPDMWTLEIVKNVNLASKAWMAATESDQLPFPLKVGIAFEKVPKAIEDFTNWCLKQPPVETKFLAPVVGDGVPDQPPIPPAPTPIGAGNLAGGAGRPPASPASSTTKGKSK